MITTHRLASMIEQIATATEREPRTVARLVTGSGDTLDRWEAGIGLTLNRAARILTNISARWPSDLDWPEDIPRPDVTTVPARGAPLNTNKSIKKEGAV